MPVYERTNTTGLEAIWNLEHSVGLGGANMEADVMLVQYMLGKVYAHPFSWAAPAGTMKVDGVCGPTTRKWVQAFQNDLNRAKPTVQADGRMDRARRAGNPMGPGTVIATTSSAYTIVHLNRLYADYYGDLFLLVREPGVPSRLRAALLRPYTVIETHGGGV